MGTDGVILDKDSEPVLVLHMPGGTLRAPLEKCSINLEPEYMKLPSGAVVLSTHSPQVHIDITYDTLWRIRNWATNELKRAQRHGEWMSPRY